MLALRGIELGSGGRLLGFELMFDVLLRSVARPLENIQSSRSKSMIVDHRSTPMMLGFY
jgi:hypothetical protein